jgi:DNA-binding protein HU-beta
MKLTKKELEQLIIDKDETIGKDVLKTVTDMIFDLTAEKLSKNVEVSVPNFGKFKIVEKEARTGRNPQTGETVRIKARRSVKFSNSKTLKDTLNK